MATRLEAAREIDSVEPLLRVEEGHPLADLEILEEEVLGDGLAGGYVDALDGLPGDLKAEKLPAEEEEAEQTPQKQQAGHQKDGPRPQPDRAPLAVREDGGAGGAGAEAAHHAGEGGVGLFPGRKHDGTL